MQEADHFSPPPPHHQEKPLSSLTRFTVRAFSLAPCFHPGLQGYWLFSTQQSESSFKKRNQSRPLLWSKPIYGSLTQVHCKCLTGPLRLCGFWPLTVSLASSSALLPLTTALGPLALWFPLAEMLSSQIVTWLVSSLYSGFCCNVTSSEGAFLTTLSKIASPPIIPLSPFLLSFLSSTSHID